MTKSNIKDGLRAYGEVITITQLADYLGVDRHTASQMLRGVPHWKVGNAKRYTVDDVAEELFGRLTV